MRIAPIGRVPFSGMHGPALAVLLLGMLALPAQAQVDLTVFGGYQFWGNLDAVCRECDPQEAGKFSILESANLGAEIGFTIPAGTQLFVRYLLQPTALEFKPVSGLGREELFDMNVHYIEIGGLQGIQRGPVYPYGRFGAGVTVFDPQAAGRGSEWKASVTAGIGVRYFISPRVAVRLEADLLMPILWASGGLWCGTGGGCSVGVSTGSALFQGNMTGGLVFRFGQPSEPRFR